MLKTKDDKQASLRYAQINPKGVSWFASCFGLLLGSLLNVWVFFYPKWYYWRLYQFALVSIKCLTFSFFPLYVNDLRAKRGPKNREAEINQQQWTARLTLIGAPDTPKIHVSRTHYVYSWFPCSYWWLVVDVETSAGEREGVSVAYSYSFEGFAVN